MSDLISRDDAKRTIDNIDTFCAGWRDYAIEQIDSLPTIDPVKWIPCKERLPERGVSVLISHVGYVSEDYLDVDDGALFFWNSGLDLEEERQNIAWMPLPKPWEGKEE